VHLADERDVAYEGGCLHEAEEEGLLVVDYGSIGLDDVKLLLLDGLNDGLFDGHGVFVLHHRLNVLPVHFLRLWVLLFVFVKNHRGRRRARSRLFIV